MPFKLLTMNGFIIALILLIAIQMVFCQMNLKPAKRQSDRNLKGFKKRSKIAKPINSDNKGTNEFIDRSFVSRVDDAKDFLKEALMLTSKKYSKLKTEVESNVNEKDSVIYRRCFGYLACEFVIPMVELNNIAIMDGIIHTLGNASSSLTKSTMKQSMKFHGSKSESYLPSVLATLGDNSYDYVAGLQVKIATSRSMEFCNHHWRNESVYFLLPWEIHNAYHSLNDNLLVLLTSAYIQTLTSPVSLDYLKRSLYLFNWKLHSKTPTLMYNLLYRIFPRIESARSILSPSQRPQEQKQSPVCIRHGTWGTGAKVFYRDSLVGLRNDLYNLLRSVLQMTMPSTVVTDNTGTLAVEALSQQTQQRETTQQQQQQQAPVISGWVNSQTLPASQEHYNNHPHRKPRVVIVSRQATSSSASSNNGFRKLSGKTESALSKQFESNGFEVIICCDFKRQVKSMDMFLDIFMNMDICIGIHGAGLSNCVFGRPGMVVVELQVLHAYGFDSFMKIAHMARGHYIHFDTRNSTMLTGSAPGAYISPNALNKLVQTAIGVLEYSRKESLADLTMKMDSIRLPTDFHDPKIDPSAEMTERISPDRALREKSLTVRDSLQIISTSEIYLDFKKHAYYISPQYKSQHQQLLQKYILPRLETTSAESSLQEKFHSNHPIYQRLEQKLTELGGLKPHRTPNKNIKNKQGKNKSVFPYMTSHDHEEILIVFHPFTFRENSRGEIQREESVLGPLLQDNFFHCWKLPYFKFRLLMMPWGEHRGECDRNYIQRSRSGANDNALLTTLL